MVFVRATFQKLFLVIGLLIIIYTNSLTELDEEVMDSKSKDARMFNFASHTAGAVVLDKSPASAKGFNNFLNDDKDKYGISPCNEKKWVVIGLSEDIQITSVAIANYERYSSMLKDFTLQAANSYPTSEWLHLGDYTAEPRLGEQLFNVSHMSSAHTRYLRVKFVSHYENDALCTLSQIKVHGTTVIASFKQEVEWSDSERRDMLHQLSAEQPADSVTVGGVTPGEVDMLQLLKREMQLALNEEKGEVDQIDTTISDTAGLLQTAATPAVEPSTMESPSKGTLPATVATDDGDDHGASADSTHMRTESAAEIVCSIPTANDDAARRVNAAVGEMVTESLAAGSVGEQIEAVLNTAAVDDSVAAEDNPPGNAASSEPLSGLSASAVTEDSSGADREGGELRGEEMEEVEEEGTPVSSEGNKGNATNAGHVTNTSLGAIDGLVNTFLHPATKEFIQKMFGGGGGQQFGDGVGNVTTAVETDPSVVDIQTADAVDAAEEAEPTDQTAADSSETHDVSPFNAEQETHTLATERDVFNVEPDAASTPSTPSVVSVDVTPPTQQPQDDLVVTETAVGSGALSPVAAAPVPTAVVTNRETVIEPDTTTDDVETVGSENSPINVLDGSATSGATTEEPVLVAVAPSPSGVVPSPLASGSPSSVSIASMVETLAGTGSALAVTAGPGAVGLNCYEALRFAEFQAKMVARLQRSNSSMFELDLGSGGRGEGNNVFRLLMQRIKALEISNAIMDMYITQLTDCYRIVTRDLQVNRSSRYHLGQHSEDAELSLLSRQGRSIVDSIRHVGQGRNVTTRDVSAIVAHLARKHQSHGADAPPVEVPSLFGLLQLWASQCISLREGSVDVWSATELYIERYRTQLFLWVALGSLVSFIASLTACGALCWYLTTRHREGRNRS